MKREGLSNYDKIAQYVLSNSPVLLVYLINYVFHEHYTEKARVTQLRTIRHYESITGEIKYLEGDSLSQVEEETKRGHYHTEFESGPDGKIDVRSPDYVVQDGLIIRASEKTEEVILPKASVIMLRSNETTPESLNLAIDVEGGMEDVPIPCPVVCVDQLSLEDLLENRLYLLLPFYFLKYNFKKVEADDSKLQELREEYSDIRKRLAEDKALNDEAAALICRMLRLVMDYACVDYPKIREVFQMSLWEAFGELEPIKSFSQGYEKGVEEERAESEKKIREAKVDTEKQLKKIVMNFRNKGLSSDEIVNRFLSDDSLLQMA